MSERTDEYTSRLVRVLSALYCDAWLITPEQHRALCDIAQAHAAGGAMEAAQHMAAESMPKNPAARRYIVKDRVAILPVEGTIGRKFSSALYSSGVTSIDVLERMVNEAVEDPAVGAIMLSFDSPGGHAGGVPEVAETIRQAHTVKPVVAYADGLMASAAYWLGAHADAIYATASARVGSIGAYAAILDASRAAEMRGLRVEVFKSGKHKAAGMPGTSLSDEQRAMIQASIDKLGAKFREQVRAGRDASAPGREISDDAMQGQTFDVEDAVAMGLVDAVMDKKSALKKAAQLAGWMQ
jgi:signal peptide peptidase SppA